MTMDMNVGQRPNILFVFSDQQQELADPDKYPGWGVVQVDQK